MESVALLDRARQAGLVVLREGDRLIVRGPKRLGDLAAHLLDRKAEMMAALDAEADPGVAMALAVFPGARVVATGQPTTWPPAGGWLPSSGRRVDPYGTEPPTAPCPCCGATTWHRAGGGWTCSRCHPPPHAPRVPEMVDETLLAAAARAGFPALRLSRVETVLAGEAAWRRFARDSTSPSLRSGALAALLRRESGEEA